MVKILFVRYRFLHLFERVHLNVIFARLFLALKRACDLNGFFCLLRNSIFKVVV
jgi:hypothetical protein